MMNKEHQFFFCLINFVAAQQTSPRPLNSYGNNKVNLLEMHRQGRVTISQINFVYLILYFIVKLE